MKITKLVLTLLIFVLIVGCTTGKAVHTDTVKIGVIAPLSGPLAEYGIALKNGIELADNDLKENNVEFIFEDSLYDPKQAISSFHKLTTIDDVDLVMDWGGPTSESIAPIVDDSGKVFIAFTPDPSVPRLSKYIVADWSSPNQFGEKTVEYMKNHNLKKIGILRTENTYLNLMTDGLIAEAKKNVEIVMVDNYIWGDNNFRAAIDKLKNSDVDVVGVFLAPAQISQFYKQAKELGLNLPTIGTDFFESKDEINAAVGLMNGAVYPNMDVPKDFRARYVDLFDTDSQITSAGQGYDIAQFLIELVDYKNKETIIDSLKLVDGSEGILGKYTFEDGVDGKHLRQPVYMKQIVDGEIVTLD